MASSLVSLSRQTKRRGRRRRTMSEINVTPMVDIMSVLLFIFMITAPLLTTGIPLNLPNTKSENLQGSDKSLNISVDAEGNVYIGKDSVPLDEIVPRLMAMQKSNPDLKIIISGDKLASYGSVIELMGLLKAAGFTSVGLQTDGTNQSKKQDNKKTNKK